VAIEKGLKPALLNHKEKQARKGRSRFNFVRLKACLVVSAFDATCLSEHLGVNACVVTSAGRLARDISSTTMVKVSKDYAMANSLNQCVQVVSCDEKAFKEYF